jgi:DNA-binding NtrC family response regulator
MGKRLVGESALLAGVRAYIGKVAASDCNVLISGETGTGKELAAELIHANSARQGKPLVRLNCAAIPDTLLESELFGHERGAFTGAYLSKAGALKLADGGSILFDEIGEMSLAAQAKMLRVIESKEVHPLGGRRTLPLNLRIMAATNQDPERLVSEGKFRPDLYYRLNVARLHLPPLRDRREDIAGLLAHYLDVLNRKSGCEVPGFTDEAMAFLMDYPWPGNVRELKNLLEAVFINLPCRRLGLADLPEVFQKRLLEGGELHQEERDRLLAALFATDWNKSKAAQRLNWSRMTLYRKLTKYHLAPQPKPDS